MADDEVPVSDEKFAEIVHALETETIAWPQPFKSFYKVGNSITGQIGDRYVALEVRQADENTYEVRVVKAYDKIEAPPSVDG